MTIEKISDHVQRALDNLIPRWRSSPTMRALVTGLVEEVQELEEGVVDLVIKRYLASAEGVHLDFYGDILDQARNGRSDEDYRRLLEVKILANRGGSTPPVIGEIAARLFYSEGTGEDGRGVRYIQVQPAAYQLQTTPAKPGVEVHTDANAARPAPDEVDATTGWAAFGADTLASVPGPDGDGEGDGAFALSAVNTTGAAGGMEYAFASGPGRVYRVSFLARRGAQGVDQRIRDWGGVDVSPDLQVMRRIYKPFVLFVRASGALITIRINSGDSIAVIGDEVLVDRVEIAEALALEVGHVADAIAILLLATPAGVQLSHVTSSPLDSAFRFGDGTSGPRGFGNGKFAKLLFSG